MRAQYPQTHFKNKLTDPDRQTDELTKIDILDDHYKGYWIDALVNVPPVSPLWMFNNILYKHLSVKGNKMLSGFGKSNQNKSETCLRKHTTTIRIRITQEVIIKEI